MVHRVVFRRETDPVSPDIANHDPLSSERSMGSPAGQEADFRRNVYARRAPGGELPPAFRRGGMTRFSRGQTTIARQQADRDAYLLVLLADQELAAGRDEQARSLVEAAYAAFDHQDGGQYGCSAG